MIRRLAFGLAIIFIPNIALATVMLPEIFGDHMVLQQKADCPIWGRGTQAGEKVQITASWGESIETTVGKNGRWQATLRTPAATPLSQGGKPYHITILVPGQNQVQLRDVLIGEIWLFSGQSNMVMPCGPGYPKGWGNWFGEAQWKQDRAGANRPALRLFNVQQAASVEPESDCRGIIPGLMILPPDSEGIIPSPARGWQPCTPGVADGFSAVAYHFGAALQARLDVPVGLVVSAYGGTAIAPWVSLDGQRALLPDKNTGTEPVLTSPGALYNGMIAPVIPLRWAGVCWYQGESNNGTPQDTYASFLRALIADWRKGANQPDLPFFLVQLAAINTKKKADGLGAIRAAQAEVQDDPNVGMVVITDVTEPLNIHPPRKKEVGRRLADLALARLYDCKDVKAEFPRATSARLENGKIRITLVNADGLEAKDGNPILYFEVAGVDGVFQPATAELHTGTLFVTCPAVPQPVSIRFAWKGTDQTNLVNGAGLPLGQFKLPVSAK